MSIGRGGVQALSTSRSKQICEEQTTMMYCKVNRRIKKKKKKFTLQIELHMMIDSSVMVLGYG